MRITSAGGGTLASGKPPGTSRSCRRTRSSRGHGASHDYNFSLPRDSSLALRVGSSTLVLFSKRVAVMRIITPVLKTIAVLVPDFRTWGLSVSVFFNLYCCAGALGLSRPGGAASGLLLSLVLGYVVNLGLNVASFLRHAPAPRTVSLPAPKWRPEESVRETPARLRPTTAPSRYWP